MRQIVIFYENLGKDCVHRGTAGEGGHAILFFILIPNREHLS